MEQSVKIFFTETEIDLMVEDLGDEIRDLEESGSAEGIIGKMINFRKKKIDKLKTQPLILSTKKMWKNSHGDKFPLCDLDLKELMFTQRGTSSTGSLIFLTGRFKTGHFLGFWSENPCSTTSDQDKGWAVINPETLEIVDECETRSMGFWSGNFSEWKKHSKNGLVK